MWIQRKYEIDENLLSKGKVNLLYGPRRAGKTSLIDKLISKFSGKVYFGNGDDFILRSLLNSQDKERILSLFNSFDLIFIDEAQRITNIGLVLKIMIDNLHDSIIIASGSSSFRLSGMVGEPLTGRSRTRLLMPISIGEYENNFSGIEVFQSLENFLVFGMYPETLMSKSHSDKIDYLTELRNSYLFKDILELENIRNSDKLFDLLRLLSFQIGHEVSLNELGNNLNLSKQTVGRYLDLLEKSFIIKKIRGFSGNLRKEVVKSNRYYFWDNGIRNSVINNFNSIDQRDDIGKLWENFMIIERLKQQNYSKIHANNYFWRTYDKKEIDFVEERDGKLFGFEFKWNPKKLAYGKYWLEAYPEASFKVINNHNFLEWLI
jgi:predicted AAA+ superfamily ATPase